MKNDKKFFIFLLIGIYGSIGTGIALFIAGGVTFNFSLSIAGFIIIGAGTFLTIVIATIIFAVRHARSLPYDFEDSAAPSKREIPETPPISSAKPKKGKYILDLMDKEDEFTAELEQSGKTDLLKQYKAESEVIWNRYTGDDWDENLEQIDKLIDKYRTLE